jgi:hypothetical protein
MLDYSEESSFKSKFVLFDNVVFQLKKLKSTAGNGWLVSKVEEIQIN